MMSLKSFHLFFVRASIILALGFGAWAVDAHVTRGSGADLALGIASFVIAAGLIIYSIKVKKKLNQVTHE